MTIVCLSGLKHVSFRQSLSVFVFCISLFGGKGVQASSGMFESEVILLKKGHTFVAMEEADAQTLKKATAVSTLSQVKPLEVSDGKFSPRRDGGLMLLRLAREQGEDLMCVKLKDPCFEKGVLSELQKFPFKGVKSLTVTGLRLSEHLGKILSVFPCLEELVITRHALPLPACHSPREDHPRYEEIMKKNAVDRLRKDVKACLSPICAYMEYRSLETIVLPQILTQDPSFALALLTGPLQAYHFVGTVESEMDPSGSCELLSVLRK